MITIVKGQDKALVVKLKTSDSEFADPYDLTGVELVQACFEIEGNSIYKQYLPIIGDTTSASDLITNIASTVDIKFGQPIAGPGIPSGATVIKTPQSTTAPTPTGTIQISIPATATAIGVSLIVGSILILSPAQWGKVKIFLSETDTDQLISNSFEIKIRTAGVTLYKIFTDVFDVQDRIC